MTQNEIVCFSIVEEWTTKDLPDVSALRVWERLKKKFQPMTGASKTILCKKCAKSKFNDVTRDPEDWIIEIELFRGNLGKLGVIIDYVEMMTLILYNLPEEYDSTVENIEDKLYEHIDMLTIEIIGTSYQPSTIKLMCNPILKETK